MPIYLILFHLLQHAALWNREKNLSISEFLLQYHDHIACIHYLMRWCIKSFLEVQDECVKLYAVIQDFSLIVYNSDKLSFTAVPFPECMMSTVQMCHDIRAYYAFKQLARYTS